jgi:hypothetical protein
LAGKAEGKRLVGRPKRRWIDNNRIDLREWGGEKLIDLAQDKDHWRIHFIIAVNPLVPQNVGTYFNSCKTGGFSRCLTLVINAEAKDLLLSETIV